MSCRRQLQSGSIWPNGRSVTASNRISVYRQKLRKSVLSTNSADLPLRSFTGWHNRRSYCCFRNLKNVLVVWTDEGKNGGKSTIMKASTCTLARILLMFHQCNRKQRVTALQQACEWTVSVRRTLRKRARNAKLQIGVLINDFRKIKYKSRW
jgi:hypothetical protein